ncbi:uncharacterized protein LOC123877001 [Maniola jurtina]|uniref:uncharacterized protein LOC123877001 n=1 Tax=Maniola jurtina TaxID=191418 RepID=UPI001E688BD6|nr:uncharacterized protein LOC123877001 [Maniola jurtina]
MNVRFLAIYYLLYLVDAKLVSESTEGKNGVTETVTVIQTSEEERGTDSEYLTETIRNPRHTNEANPESNVTQSKRTAKPKAALVKKPIPKFTYTESEDDYQAKIRFPSKISDTIEHEDEDFSFDDYDFDVDHDEFAGRGKPLQPRVKVEVSRQRRPTPAKVEQPRPAPILSQSKVEILHSEGKPSIKVVRKVAGVMKEEYDEEFSAITKSSEKQRPTIAVRDTPSFREETENSGEEEMIRPMRTTRMIPFSYDTYVDKLGEKTSEFATKMLSYLPLFPQMYSSPKKVNDDVMAENTAMADPRLGGTLSD